MTTSNRQKWAVVDGQRYSVTMPLNNWDTNFHFIGDGDGGDADYLVDLQDVIDHFELENGANLDNAIAFAKELASNGVQWYWMVR